MKKLFCLVSLSLVLLLAGCDTYNAKKQFFVESSYSGYFVSVSDDGGYIVRISAPFQSPSDAQVLCEKLNKDMANYWHQR